jgi:Flp pilus assembly protein TadB
VIGMKSDHALDRARAIRMEVAAGQMPSGLDGLPADAAAALDAAIEAGAPLLDVLDGVTAGLRAERELAHAVGAAAAPARLVAIALTVLPIAAIPVLGAMTGTDPLAFYTTPGGSLVALFGGAFWLAGVAATAAIIRSAARLDTRSRGRTVDPSLAAACDVVAAGLAAGLGPPAALRLAAERLGAVRQDLLRLAMHLDLDRTPDVAAVRPLGDLLHRASRIGGPVVPALRDLAAQLRADRLAAAMADVQRLPTRLTFPAALCLLPATLLLVGAPIVAEGLGAVTGT